MAEQANEGTEAPTQRRRDEARKEGQVVAILLPRGVEGESAAEIQEKRAQRDLALTQLSSADDVADEAVDQAEEKIDELEEKLENAKEDRDATVAKAQGA